MVHESLSALLDGECNAEDLDRLLDAAERDPALKAAWSRMCQTRELRDGTRIGRGQPCIAAAVMAGLDQPDLAASPKVVPLSAPPRKRIDWKTWSGWAVAASVAMVAVTLNLGNKTSDPVSSMEAGAGGSFVPQVSSPVSAPLPTVRARNLQTVSLSADEQVVDEDLRDYLIEHSNALADRGMGGTLSYARFAAHPAVFSTEAQP